MADKRRLKIYEYDGHQKARDGVMTGSKVGVGYRLPDGHVVIAGRVTKVQVVHDRGSLKPSCLIVADEPRLIYCSSDALAYKMASKITADLNDIRTYPVGEQSDPKRDALIATARRAFEVCKLIAGLQEASTPEEARWILGLRDEIAAFEELANAALLINGEEPEDTTLDIDELHANMLKELADITD